MDTPVSIHIAKLLKEKGINISSGVGLGVRIYEDEKLTSTCLYNVNTLHAPTIAEVVMWLYEKHGIWISTQKDWDCGHCFGFDATIDSNCGIINTDTFSTPEEAYEASIGYTLNNLI